MITVPEHPLHFVGRQQTSNDLSLLNEHYHPGTIAYTAGFKKMWQLGVDDSWVSLT